MTNSKNGHMESRKERRIRGRHKTDKWAFGSNGIQAKTSAVTGKMLAGKLFSSKHLRRKLIGVTYVQSDSLLDDAPLPAPLVSMPTTAPRPLMTAAPESPRSEKAPDL